MRISNSPRYFQTKEQENDDPDPEEIRILNDAALSMTRQLDLDKREKAVMELLLKRCRAIDAANVEVLGEYVRFSHHS